MSVTTTSGSLTDHDQALGLMEPTIAVRRSAGFRLSAVPLVHLADFVELTKPRIATLELVTVTAAAVVAGLNALDLLHVLIGTALVAASASSANQWLERRRDVLMQRTCQRPLPAGRLSGRSVVVFSAATFIAGIGYLALLVNPLTTGIALLSWILYVTVYTPLKTRTTANTLVGAIAGALPILMGWTAMGRSLDVHAASLFLIIFLWQLPHFMAIAWLYRRDYADAGMRMLTVVDPTGVRAGAQAVIASLTLLPISLVPVIQPQAGNVSVYFLWAMLLGVGLFGSSLVFLVRRDRLSARWLLRASIVYLPMLLVLMMLAAPPEV